MRFCLFVTSDLFVIVQDVTTICQNSIPQWLRELLPRFPQLFDESCRVRYFELTSFGLVRSMHRAQRVTASAMQGTRHIFDDAQATRVRLLDGTMNRRKAIVRRDHILECAGALYKLFAADSRLLFVQFADEVGHGSGPTAEFYSSVCQSLQSHKLRLFRGEECKPGHSLETTVFNEEGLFPLPFQVYTEDDADQVLKHFQLLGWLLAKCLQVCV